MRRGSTLKKYIYFIVGYKGDNIYPHGTGFFYKSNEGYKFITAKHSVSDVNTFNKETLINKYDFIGIVYTDTISKTFAFIRLDIRLVKPLLPNTYFYETPDIIVFDLIGLKLNIKIYPINDLLPKPSTVDKKFDKIIIWGYPFSESPPPGFPIDSVKAKRYEGKFADVSHLDPYYPPNSKLYSVIQPEVIQGMSGAPVFFKYYSGKGNAKTEIYEFAGLLFGTNVPYKAGYVHTYDATMAEIVKVTLFKYTF